MHNSYITIKYLICKLSSIMEKIKQKLIKQNNVEKAHLNSVLSFFGILK